MYVKVQLNRGTVLSSQGHHGQGYGTCAFIPEDDRATDFYNVGSGSHFRFNFLKDTFENEKLIQNYPILCCVRYV